MRKGQTGPASSIRRIVEKFALEQRGTGVEIDILEPNHPTADRGISQFSIGTETPAWLPKFLESC